MSDINRRSVLAKAKEEIAFLESQQIEIYEKLCKTLKTKDTEGILWDYVFNDDFTEDEVLNGTVV